MNAAISRRMSKLLRSTADKLDAGTCELTEEEAMEIMSVLSHQSMSKDEACSYVGLQRSRFDDLVRLGILPKGKKRRGYKELRWYKDELDTALKEYNEKYR